jgi:hypothetical protein
MGEEICGIDHRDHGIEAGQFMQASAVLATKGKGLRDGQRLGHASGFDEQAIETAFVRKPSDFLDARIGE